MKCPYCGSQFNGNPQYCPNCKQPLSRARKSEPEQVQQPERPEHERRTPTEQILIIIATVLSLIAICFGIYKLTFWVGNYRINRLYTRGEYTPTVHETTMDDGRIGRSIVFYGEDGDQIFLPELKKSLTICGGIARVSIADSDWFGNDVTEIQSANVNLSPVLVEENGSRTQLPGISFSVDVPESPLTVISPEKKDLSVVTSRYLLELQVVPGSTVLVNGEDVTDTVDRSGLLSKNVNVYPIGDNAYSVIVRTPKHHESRHDITIYREAFDINFELDTSVGNTSSNKTMSITGTVEVGANITVETEYIEDSLQIDPATGKFSFIARLGDFGDNVIRFKATMEGKQDAIISMNVDYKPTLAEYSAMAWAMDYSQLRRLYEQWDGQVFKCEGPIIDVVYEDDASYLIMNVGTDAEQNLLILENKTSIKEPSFGRSYTAYADVSGRRMYNALYYPALTARYMDLTPIE